MTTKPPTTHARVEELILICQGLSLEQERSRVQTSYVGELVQDLLRSVITLRAELKGAAGAVVTNH